MHIKFDWYACLIEKYTIIIMIMLASILVNILTSCRAVRSVVDM